MELIKNADYMEGYAELKEFVKTLSDEELDSLLTEANEIKLKAKEEYKRTMYAFNNALHKYTSVELAEEKVFFEKQNRKKQ